MKAIENAVHLCVDMQTIFAPGELWATPWMERVLPNVVKLAESYRMRTVFTRFIPPMTPEERPGMWQDYYRKWHAATRAEAPARLLELVPELARLVPPAHVVDKPAYSGFHASRLATYLSEKKVRTLVVTGAETDVCVLSTVMGAVDLGYRIILADDGVCSSSDTGHDALMTMYRTRFSGQIEIASVDEIQDAWGERG